MTDMSLVGPSATFARPTDACLRYILHATTCGPDHAATGHEPIVVESGVERRIGPLPQKVDYFPVKPGNAASAGVLTLRPQLPGA